MSTDALMQDVVSGIRARLEFFENQQSTDSDTLKSAALESIDIYAPAAERLGLVAEKEKLLSYGMQYGHPEEYKEIKKLLQEAEASCDLVFRTFKAPICSLLDDMGFEYTFDYRMKSVYSIWNKMVNLGVTFDEVYDLFATRVVFKPHEKAELLVPDPRAVDPSTFISAEKLDCWRIYTIVTSLYRARPDKIRDWITHPRPSGYEALQVTVMGPDCNWVELQIRSQRMDDIAERGIASHWKYKGGSDLNTDDWLKETLKKMKESEVN